MNAIIQQFDSPIALSELGRIGKGPHRPECVFATGRGERFAADGRGGMAQVWHAGSQTLFRGERGGNDLRTAYLGCLLGDAITSFRAPVAGHPPVHWRYPVAQ